MQHLLSPSDGESPAQRFFDGRARQEDFAALGVGAAGGAALTYGLTVRLAFVTILYAIVESATSLFIFAAFAFIVGSGRRWTYAASRSS